MKKFARIATLAIATAVAIGSISIPATAATKKATTSVKITNVKNNELELYKGDTFTLKTKVTVADNKISKALKFTSTRNAVATVSNNGKITANRYGDTTITATLKADKNATASIKLNVLKKSELDKSGYTELWRDDFNGTELNRKDWNVETHEAGWVNAELQEYVDSKDNIYVEDGKLILKPVKNGDKITSGRVNTQGKHDFTYGLFEARVEVPTGKGYLPAFWMMPTNEGKYGQWPKCGEIDIMEVMGHETDKVYGTIHYGEPHGQSQATKVIQDGDFASEYHDFALEWEPGKIVWYVDGVKYHEERDWFTKKPGEKQSAYPAPFNQPFYVIFNLAVGGSWVGYPDETTTYADQDFAIDYVSISRKEQSYYDRLEATAKAPAREEVKEPKDGIYVKDGSFTAKDNIGAKKNWNFLTAQGGAGSAEVVNDATFGKNAKAVKISSTSAGTEDYAVQFVQAKIPFKKGTKYKLTFDAYAKSNRTMVVDVSAPDLNYIRYMADTKVTLTTKKKTYSYEIAMANDDDANARLEFNLGHQGSTADVFISNVKIEKTGTFKADYEVDPTEIIKNGQFDGSLIRWETWNNEAAAWSYSVDPTADNKQFEATVTNTGTEAWHIQLKQSDVPLVNGQKYKLSFDAKSTVDRKIQVNLQRNGSLKKDSSGNEDWTPYLQDEMSVTSTFAHYEKEFTMNESTDDEGVFNIGFGAVDRQINEAHTITIDNIVIVPVN